jgi:hypothetical protein
VVRGQRRLAEAKVLEKLKIWIEDLEDIKRKYPEYNWQDNVCKMWKRFSGLGMNRMDAYLRLLPATHQAMWQALAG